MATITWVGGMIFLALLSSEVEKLGPQFGAVMGRMTKIFSKLSVLSILILIITGIWLTALHGGTERVQSDWVLKLKHIIFLLAVTNGVLIGAKIVPNMEKYAAEKSPKVLVWRKRLKTHSLVNLILGILIVLLAIL